jgi:hypothetical protein
VKFPAVDTAKIRIKQEFDALLELASDGCRVSPRPVLLHPELKFSVQSYLAGSSTGPAIQQAHIDFLIGLVNAERRVDLAAVREQLRLRLQQSIAGGLLTNAAQGTLQQLLDKGRWVGSVPAARVHGDFAPWNLKRADDGQIVAVDWEDSAASGLPFLDLHHFQRSVTMRLGRKCTVPWQSYTMALMGADRHLTRDAAEIALVAAGIDHWLSRHWMRGWTEWSI